MANGLLAKNGLIVTGSVEVQNAVTASTFSGDGSGLSGVSDFPYTGSAVISGSLDVKGDTSITGSTYIKGAIWAQGTNSIIYLGSQYSALQIKTGGIYLGGTVNNGGNNGVSIGNNAGRFATGNNNALIGNQAGYRAAYSNGYVAVGKNSNSGDGAYNKDNSVGIGIGSNYNGSTNTVAVGGYSGNYSSNTPYTSSVFIGTSAGTKGGSNSVYVGHQSRGEGIGNTALGYQTGLYSSGSNNLFLGYQAGYNLTGSNQLIIANNSSSALITGDFANNTFNISGSVSASTYYGDGSNLTGISSDPFPYTGSAVISGSLTVTGSFKALLPTSSNETYFLTYNTASYELEARQIATLINPKVEYLDVTASISSGTSITLPNGLSYISSSTYEYLEVFFNGLRLRYDRDFVPTSTTTIQNQIAFPSGSELTFKSLKA
jgi:trimeric autotransporter adhesin